MEKKSNSIYLLLQLYCDKCQTFTYHKKIKGLFRCIRCSTNRKFPDNPQNMEIESNTNKLRYIPTSNPLEKKIRCFNCGKLFDEKDLILYIDPLGKMIHVCHSCANKLNLFD